MTTRTACVVVLVLFLFVHSVDLFAQNSLVSWSALDMGFASPASATIQIYSVAGQVLVGSLQSDSTMIESGFLADTLFWSAVTSVAEHGDVPKEFALEQNYPNPFNPSTTIGYALPSRSHVSLTVFNTLGQQVALLQNDEREAGYHEVKFDAKNLPSGVYFYRIQVRPLDSAIGRDSKGGAGSLVETRRLLLLK
jgi:hypothetical protein